MTVREMINKLMDLELDQQVYITEIDKEAVLECVGFVDTNPIIKSNKQIIDISVNGFSGHGYNDKINCITIN